MTCAAGASPVVVSIEINQVCPLDCPFCYSTPRRGGCRWSREDLGLLIEEAARLSDRVAVVFGDGEPLATPRLTGWALRRALDSGAWQTGFTTSGVPRSALAQVELEAGGPISEPEGSITVSLDEYKVAKAPRCGGLEGRLSEAWRVTSSYLDAPREPPEPLCTILVAWERGWSVAVNMLVTRRSWALAPLIRALAVEGVIRQVNLLAPKPLKSLLPVAYISVAARLASYLARRLEPRVRVAVDSSMMQLMSGRPGCEAGGRLLSITACGLVKPCSFAGGGVKWRPGMLGEIAGYMERVYRGLRGGWCPFMAKHPPGSYSRGVRGFWARREGSGLV